MLDFRLTMSLGVAMWTMSAFSAAPFSRSLSGVTLGLSLLSMLAAPPLARAQECLDYGEFIRFTNGFETSHFAHAVALDDGYAYVALRSAGVQVLDISDPLDIHAVAAIDGPDWPRDIAVSGSHAYVAHAVSGLTEQFAGLQVLDIADPSAPSLVAEIATGGNANEIVIEGKFAYVAAAGSGLCVIDISDPLNPQIVGTADTPGEAWGVAVANGLASVADADSGLHLIDVSDPLNPHIIGSIATEGRAWGTALSGNYAYVAGRRGGLHVVDIADPSSPNVVFTDGTMNAYGVTAEGAHVFVAEFDRLSVMDASTPYLPRRIGTGPGSPYALTDFVVADTSVYLTLDRGWLHVLDIAIPISAPHLGELDIPGSAADLAVSGQHAYVADLSTSVQIVDLSNPRTPRAAGTVDVTDAARGAIASGDHVYVRGDVGIDVLDVSNAPDAQLVGHAPIPSGLRSGNFAVSGDSVYVPGYHDGLFLVDVSDPFEPQVVHTIESPRGFLGVALDGDYAALIDVSGNLFWLDMSDPRDPAVLGSMEVPGQARDVVVSGRYTYVAARAEFLAIDGSDPTSPFVVGRAALPYSATDLLIDGDYAYMTAWQAGVYVIDITTPSALRMVGYVNSSNGQGLAISGDQIVVADGRGGLIVAAVQCGTPTPIFLEEFVVGASGRTVEVHWQTSDVTTADAFALRAQSGDREWVVEHTALEPGFFAATDRSPNLLRSDTVTYRLFYAEENSTWILVGEEQVQSLHGAPRLQLLSAVPNPFNPRTTLFFNVENAGHVTLDIYRLDGRRVIRLLDERRASGRNGVEWRGSDDFGRRVSSGVYVARLVTHGSIRSQKLVMLK